MDGLETDTATPGDADDLMPALEVIEQQPLAARASAYSAVLDDLARRLESGPAGA
jgi:hypothetical protein